jgi:hypothetical protein
MLINPRPPERPAPAVLSPVAASPYTVTLTGVRRHSQ